MSSAEMRRMNKLRQVMRLSARGKGMAASVVETFKDSEIDEERKTARRILLGRPLEDSVGAMTSGGGQSRDLLLYLVDQAKMNAPEASRQADRLTAMFERWVRAKQERLVDQRIMQTRSVMVSAILGGVTAMLAALAPVLSTFQLTLTQQAAAPAGSQYLGLFLAVPSAFFLGMFFSPRRALLNSAISAAAYMLVVYFFAPLVLAI
jgi:hypothetical protein